MAGGAAIVREAGGVVLDVSGESRRLVFLAPKPGAALTLRLSPSRRPVRPDVPETDRGEQRENSRAHR